MKKYRDMEVVIIEDKSYIKADEVSYTLCDISTEISKILGLLKGIRTIMDLGNIVKVTESLYELKDKIDKV